MISRAVTAIHALGLVLFLAAVATIVGVQWLVPLEDTRENRKLAQMPPRPGSAQEWAGFPGRFSAYMDDNFGFRGSLLRWHNLLMLEFGVSPSDKVLLGRDGWLYYTNHELTDQNRGAMPLSDQELADYARRFREQREWVEGRGLHYLLMPVPDKNTLYPEYLPDSVRMVGPSRLSQFLDYMDTLGEPYIYPLAALQAARDRDERIYYQTDTHWTCLGAFVAYQELMDQVEPLGLPGVYRVTEEELIFRQPRDIPGRDMARTMLQLEDVVREQRGIRCDYREKRDLVATRLEDGYQARKPYNLHAQREHWSYALAGKEPRTRLLLYRDSYSNALMPFLFHTFDEIIVVPRPRLKFDAELIERYQPDIVIYEFVERALYWPPSPIALGDGEGNNLTDASL